VSRSSEPHVVAMALLLCGAVAIFLIFAWPDASRSASGVKSGAVVKVTASEHPGGVPGTSDPVPFGESAPVGLTSGRASLGSATHGPATFRVMCKSGLSVERLQVSPDGSTWKELVVIESSVQIPPKHRFVRSPNHVMRRLPTGSAVIELTPTMMLTLRGDGIGARIETDSATATPRLDSKQLQVGAHGSPAIDTYVILLTARGSTTVGPTKPRLEVALTGGLDLQISSNQPYGGAPINIDVELDLLPLASGTGLVKVLSDRWPGDLYCSVAPARGLAPLVHELKSWGMYAIVPRRQELSAIGPASVPIELSPLLQGESYLVSIASHSTGTWGRGVLIASHEGGEVVIRLQHGMAISLHVYDESTGEDLERADIEWRLTHEDNRPISQDDLATWHGSQRHKLVDGVARFALGPQVADSSNLTWPPPSRWVSEVSAPGYHAAVLRASISFAESELRLEVPVAPKSSRLSVADLSGIGGDSLFFSHVTWIVDGEARSAVVECFRALSSGGYEVILRGSPQEVGIAERDILEAREFVLSDSSGQQWVGAFSLQSENGPGFRQVPSQLAQIDLKVNRATPSGREFVSLGWTWRGIDYKFDRVELARSEGSVVSRAFHLPGGARSVWFELGPESGGGRLELMGAGLVYRGELSLP